MRSIAGEHEDKHADPPMWLNTSRQVNTMRSTRKQVNMSMSKTGGPSKQACMMRSIKDAGVYGDVDQAEPKQVNTMRSIKSAGEHADIEEAAPPCR